MLKSRNLQHFAKLTKLDEMLKNAEFHQTGSDSNYWLLLSVFKMKPPEALSDLVFSSSSDLYNLYNNFYKCDTASLQP